MSEALFASELERERSTARLRLRPFGLGDVEAVLAYSRKPGFARHLPLPEAGAYTRDDAEERLARLRLADWSVDATWALCLADDVGDPVDAPIGSVRLSLDAPNYKADLGYALDPDRWGQGYAREAVRATLDHAFETWPSLAKVECHCTADNAASRRLAEAVGMRHEGRLRRFVVIRGRAVDIDWFGLLRAEWERA